MSAHDMAVEAAGLTKRYGDAVAVDGISFRVPRASCFGFLGPNGAGKSSTMKMIYGRTPITAGSLRVLGLDAHRSMRDIKRRIGIVPQEDNLDPDFTTRDNLVVYARYFDIPLAVARQRAGELLAFAQMEDRAAVPVDRLSGGLRRRLVIARALVNRPELVVLDEPTTGLDPQVRHAVWNRLRALRDDGVTLLLTTHYMDEAAELCDRLVVMDRGRILAEGAPAELVARHAGAAVLEVERGAAPQRGTPVADAVRPGPAADDLPQPLREETVGERVHLHMRSLADAERLAATLAGSHYRLRPATLEDVFLHLTGRSMGGEG